MASKAPVPRTRSVAGSGTGARIIFGPTRPRTVGALGDTLGLVNPPRTPGMRGLAHDPKRRRRVPIPPREVGEVRGAAAVRDGRLAERGDGGPGGGVVDVLVEGEALAQAVDDAPEHHEVHAAMPALIGGVIGDALVEGVVIAVVPGLEVGALRPGVR